MLKQHVSTKVNIQVYQQTTGEKRLLLVAESCTDWRVKDSMRKGGGFLKSSAATQCPGLAKAAMTKKSGAIRWQSVDEENTWSEGAVTVSCDKH